MSPKNSLRVNTLLRQERLRRGWSQQDLADHLGITPVTMNRWERGIQHPSPLLRLKLCQLLGKSGEELGLVEVISSPFSASAPQQTVSEPGPAPSSPAEPAGLWTIPYLRNPHFTGRDGLLEHLAKQLSSAHPNEASTTRRAVLSQPQAIKGLGGIGKTQIAVEYAYRARSQEHHTHFLWINAASEEAILTSFQTLGQRLPDFPSYDEQDQRKLIAAILRRLEAYPEPWLLIFDNADEPSLVQPYLPHQGQGSILLTTRASAVSWLANPIEVEQMGLLEGTQFLLQRTRRLSASDEESNEATNIVIALDGFPLALDQAGAYIEETGCRFRDYLQLYEQHRAALLARRGKQSTHYPASVATTWDLSFQQIEQTQPAAAELLRLCALLSPDHIPEELITEGAMHWPVLLQEAVTDPLRFNDLLEALLAFSLIKRLAEERLLSLHRLVQAVQLDRMDLEEQHSWAEQVVCVVNALFPKDPKEEVDTWPQCLRYLEQAQACSGLIEQWKLMLPEGAELLHRTGIYLYEHASYVQAEQLHQRALHIWEQSLGPEHPLAASALHELARLYMTRGKPVEAEHLYRRALHIGEQHLGSEHPLVVRSLNGLAILAVEQGRYQEAEPLYRRALHIGEQHLGSEHPLVAYLLHNLGVLFVEQGRYREAEPLYWRALHIREQSLGSEHPLVAYPLNGLAFLYKRQGKYAQAEPMGQRALCIWEQNLGPEHSLVAYALYSLADLFKEQGVYREAEAFYQRALSIWEQSLGSEHSLVAYPLNGLADLCLDQGRSGEAEVFYQHALRIREQSLRFEHPLVAYPLNGLANLFRERGQYEQAEAYYQRVLTIRQYHLGPQHIDTAQTLADLAHLREKQQQPGEALLLYQQAFAIREQTLGVHHPKTIETHQHLCAILQALGRAEEAAACEETDLNRMNRGELARETSE